MKTQTDNLIMGYIDGELSPSEVAEMDRHFTDSERVRMQKEIQFESKLFERLGTKLCPDELWNKTLKILHSEDDSSSSRANIIKFVNRPVVWLALAASIAIMLGAFQMTRDSYELFDQVTTVAALNSEVSQIPIEKLLADNNIALTLAALSPDSHHAIEILGGYNCKISGEHVTVVNFSCCGEPLRVLVAAVGGKASKTILKNFENIQIMDKRGNYQLALIGKHPGQEVLSLFKEV